MAAPLDDFAALDWRVVNDGVMGGVSTGQLHAEPGKVRFGGALSLENNGGFVSIRTAPAALQLDRVQALRVTVVGDGRTWDLTLRRADVPIRAGSYRAAISTSPEPTTIEVPLSAFRPTSFGRPVRGAPALDAAPERIDSVGFLLADKQPGAYTLEVLAIEPVPGPRPPRAGIERIRQTLAATVAVGVPAFNRGDVARCRTLYAAALRSVVDEPALSAGERALVEEALQQAQAQPPAEAAWTLRYAIDSVSAG